MYPVWQSVELCTHADIEDVEKQTVQLSSMQLFFRGQTNSHRYKNKLMDFGTQNLKHKKLMLQATFPSL